MSVLTRIWRWLKRRSDRLHFGIAPIDPEDRGRIEEMQVRIRHACRGSRKARYPRPAVPFDLDCDVDGCDDEPCSCSCHDNEVPDEVDGCE